MQITFGKRILSGLFYVILAVIMVSAMNFYLYTPYPPNQTYVYSGDLISISGTTPIEISLYATDAEGITTLNGSDLVISTHPGVMPDYYEFKGTIIPDRYIISGSDASLILSRNGVVDNPGVDIRQVKINQILIVMMATLGFILGFLIPTPWF